MAKTPRRTAGAAVVMAVLGWTFPATAAESSAAVADLPSLTGPDGRVPSTAAVAVRASAESPNADVRSDSAAIVDLIARGNDISATFRHLVEGIGTSDGVVYVQDGVCLNHSPACFIGVTMAGSGRNLWIRVSLKMHHDDCDLIGSIAHELRHTLEVLEVPTVTSTASMVAFYRWAGFRGSAQGYETQMAIDAGNAVRSECSRELARRR